MSDKWEAMRKKQAHSRQASLASCWCTFQAVTERTGLVNGRASGSSGHHLANQRAQQLEGCTFPPYLPGAHTVSAVRCVFLLLCTLCIVGYASFLFIRNLLPVRMAPTRAEAACVFAGALFLLLFAGPTWRAELSLNLFPIVRVSWFLFCFVLLFPYLSYLCFRSHPSVCAFVSL